MWKCGLLVLLGYYLTENTNGPSWSQLFSHHDGEMETFMDITGGCHIDPIANTVIHL